MILGVWVGACVYVCVCVLRHTCVVSSADRIQYGGILGTGVALTLNPSGPGSRTSPLVWSLCAPGWYCSKSGPSLWGFAFISMICRKKEVCPSFSTERWCTHRPSTGIVPLSRLSKSEKLWKLKAFWQLLPGLNIFGSKTWCELQLFMLLI